MVTISSSILGHLTSDLHEVAVANLGHFQLVYLNSETPSHVHIIRNLSLGEPFRASSTEDLQAPGQSQVRREEHGRAVRCFRFAE